METLQLKKKQRELKTNGKEEETLQTWSNNRFKSGYAVNVLIHYKYITPIM